LGGVLYVLGFIVNVLFLIKAKSNFKADIGPLQFDPNQSWHVS